MTTEHVLDKVRKLLRLAGNNNSPAEAASAASAAQDLLDRHNLSQAMLELDTVTEVDEPIQNFNDSPLDTGDGSSTLDRWRGQLAMVITRLNACKVWKSGARLMLVGRPSDADTVRYLYSWLVREVEQLATSHGRGQGRTWRNNFRLGVVETITRKLEEQHQQFAATVRAEAQDNSQALVRVNQALAKVEAKREAVEVWTKTHMKLSKGRSTRTTYNSGARAAGREAAERINIAARTTRLTSGAKGLKGATQ